MTSSSAYAPFRHRIFTVLWVATLVSNIGTWMFNVTSGWLMAELSPSPLMVSLVQAATALPVFLFALPAGALGDIFDRRKLLLVTQICSAMVMFIFAGLLWAGLNNAGLLLLFTFLTGAGAAFAAPAFSAITPRLVPKESLQPAIVLNGVSINIARAVGPALGGFILAAAGAVMTVTLNAASFIAVIAALLWWKANGNAGDTLPREHMAGAMRAGLRFALRSEGLRHTIIRALAFFTFASAYWALLPLVAKDLLHGGPGLYGILLTAIGAGAVAGTFLLPALQRKLDMNLMVALATLGTALSMMVFAYGGNEAAGIIAGIVAGLSWIIVLSSFNLSAQVSLPDWVRSRGLAIFQMTFFGAMTAGSMLWGQLAVHVGLPASLTAAAALAAVAIPLTWRFRLNLDENRDHSPSNHWPEPMPLSPVDNGHGPVLVTLEYLIDDADREKFFRLIREMGIIRRRDGAIQWGFFEDVEKHGRFIEMFTAESWVAHLRQHKRVSAADKEVQDAIAALHRGDAPPEVTHAVTPQPGKPEALPKHHHD